MAFSEAGRIDLYSGAPTAGGVQTLTLLANGDVGIGVAAPGQALVVNGSVQSMKDGFDFGDGVLQDTAAIATTVPVGPVTTVAPAAGSRGHLASFSMGSR